MTFNNNPADPHHITWFPTVKAHILLKPLFLRRSHRLGVSNSMGMIEDCRMMRVPVTAVIKQINVIVALTVGGD